MKTQEKRRKLDSCLRRNDGRRETCRIALLAFLLLLLLLALSGCEKKSTPQKAPEKAKPVWNGTGEGFSPQRVAEDDRTSRNDRKEIEINLKETRFAVIPEDYDKWGNISFSADGRKVFYKARKKDAEFMVAASTGSENIGPAYKSISWLVMSPEGRRFAFGGAKRGKKRLIVDNKELRDLYHEEVAPAAFSPDGRFVACEVGGLNEKKWFIVVSDGEKEVYRSRVYPDTFRQPVFSPDGRLLVFELGDDKMKVENYKRTVFFLDVSGRKIIKERLYTDHQIGNFSFSSDSLRVIYDIQKEGKKFLVLQDFASNNERQLELPYTIAGQVVLSPDGKYIIYIATKEGKQYLIVSPWESPAQGKGSGPYEGVAQAIFSPDLTTVVYRAMKNGKWRIVAGGKEGASYDSVGEDAVFSTDGAKIAYPAMKGSGGGHRNVIMDGKWFMVVSPVGKPAVVKEGPVYDMVVTPVFSPDGKYIAFRARTGPMEKAKRFIVIADTETGRVIKEGPANDEVWPPVWSPDGKAVAYGARIGRELWWKVEKLGE